MLVLILISWYGYMLGRYYPELFTKKTLRAAPVKWLREKEVLPDRKVDQHAMVHELMEELKLIFAAAVKDQLAVEQVKEAIGLRLKKYSALKEEIKLSVGQHIASEFSLQLKMTIPGQDINALWS